MPYDIEHPIVTEINQLGYPRGIHEQQHWGDDVMGDKIFEGDEIIVIGNEIVLERNLEDYLIVHLGANYTQAI